MPDVDFAAIARHRSDKQPERWFPAREHGLRAIRDMQVWQLCHAPLHQDDFSASLPKREQRTGPRASFKQGSSGGRWGGDGSYRELNDNFGLGVVGSSPRWRQQGLCFVVHKQRTGVQVLITLLASLQALCIVCVPIQDAHLRATERLSAVFHALSASACWGWTMAHLQMHI